MTMRHVYAFLFCLIASSFSFCQNSRADLFAGYSYVNIDTNGLSPRQSANGWEASVSGNFNKWFAVEVAASGYYKNYSVNAGSVGTASAKLTDYSYSSGPRINFRPIFIHALFGGDHLTGSASASVGGVSGSASASQNGLAGVAGGGVQFKVSGPWSVRVSADYVFTRHNVFGGPSVTQNNYRAGVGIVYSFGAKHASDKPPSAAPEEVEPRRVAAPAIPRRAGINLSLLGVVVTLGRSVGAEITEERPNGVATLAGIHVGDVINAVDGKSVRTPMELATELSNREAGSKVRLGYLIHGQWQSEAIVILGESH
jgi:hypothetical protein